jgi:hypothetical protein
MVVAALEDSRLGRGFHFDKKVVYFLNFYFEFWHHAPLVAML